MSDDERDWLDELDDPTDRLQEPEGAPDPICTGCNRKPAEIQEYIDPAPTLTRPAGWRKARSTTATGTSSAPLAT
jgi:hypothetical protein